VVAFKNRVFNRGGASGNYVSVGWYVHY